MHGKKSTEQIWLRTTALTNRNQLFKIFLAGGGGLEN
jgi:hypothetical protein